ncbi:hypothetical protein QUV16_23150, partial [Xanthomonas citri pv. citri]
AEDGTGPNGRGNGYFTGTGATARVRTQNDQYDTGVFHYLIPQRNALIGGRNAIPPFDKYGFARSSDFNPAYFNPNETYARWKQPNAAQEIVDFPNADPAAASSDPTDVNAAKYDLRGVLMAYDPVNNYSEYFTAPQGMTIPAGTEYYM